MPVIEVSVNGEEFDLVKRPRLASTINLDNLFRESMKKARSACPGDVIVRCDTLPAIDCDEKNFIELFDNLIGLIFDMSGMANRIFLFVECEEENGRSGPDNRIYRNYIIRFHSNFSAGEEWKQRHAETLSRCNEIISNCDGSFIVNKINNTGCLFLIKLPANQK